MKKILAMLVAFLLVMSPVLAAEEIASELPDPGILPDSPLYGLKRGFEGIEGVFKFSERARAEHKLKLAEKRLAESKKMSENGKPEYAEELFQEYNKNMENANYEMGRAVAKGENVDDLVARVTARRAKHMEVLQRVRDNAPEQARSGLSNAIQNAETSTEKIMAHVEEKVQKREGIHQEETETEEEEEETEVEDETEDETGEQEQNQEANDGEGQSQEENLNQISGQIIRNDGSVENIDVVTADEFD